MGDVIEQVGKKQKIENATQLYDVINTSTSISFSANFRNREMKLIELNQEVAKRIENGESLKIIGSIGSEAVLCTNDRTFAIKKVETSNNVFAIPPSSTGKYNVISKSIGYYYELKPIIGKVDQLGELLKDTQYSGSENDSDLFQANLFTRSNLDCRVQASKEELDNALKSLNVVELNGKMRMISQIAIQEVTRNLLDTIIEKNWPLDKINEEECRIELQDTNTVLLNHVLSILGIKYVNDNGNTLWNLNEDNVAKATAHILFSSEPQKIWPCQEFLSTWATRTPGVAIPNSLLLSGIAIKGDNIKKGNNVSIFYHYYPDYKQPLDPVKRLEYIFSIKKKFMLEELKPFVLDFVCSNGSGDKPKSVPEFLLKHTILVDDMYLLK